MPRWRVVEVRALPGFAALRDAALFAQVYVDHGAVTWPGEIDLAPDAMYDEISANGTRIVE